MSRKNAQAISDALKARQQRKAEREANEPFQKVLNTKSPQCRKVLGMLLYQSVEVRKEILDTAEELKNLGM
jgi:hypothetical protein